MSSNREKLVEALYAGAVQAMSKPFPLQELLIKLDLAIRYHRPQGSGTAGRP